MKIGKNDVLPSQMTIFYFCGANILWKTLWGLGDILSTKSKRKENAHWSNKSCVCSYWIHVEGGETKGFTYSQLIKTFTWVCTFILNLGDKK